MRDVDFSPDSSYFVVTRDRGVRRSGLPVRRDHPLGDLRPPAPTSRPPGATTPVATRRTPSPITGSAVYVGGHMRWMNNPYAGDAVGPGAVPREGIAALDPVSGLPAVVEPRPGPRRRRLRHAGHLDRAVGRQRHRPDRRRDPPQDRLLPARRRDHAAGAGARHRPQRRLPARAARLGSASSDVFYRVNAGGPALQSADDGPDWMSDADAAAAYTQRRQQRGRTGARSRRSTASVPQVAE